MPHEPRRGHGDLGAAAHEFEEPDAQETREALVDAVEARQARRSGALLRGEIERPHARGVLGSIRLVLHRHALQQGVDLVIAQELVGHRATG